jgi:hypothetical protein
MDLRRLQLQQVLETLLGSQNVYFQPPANVQMQYPAIVYRRDDMDTQFAGNAPYRLTVRYQVTVIAQDPDNDIRGKVAKLPMCTFNRAYPADNLNHDVFDLYF